MTSADLGPGPSMLQQLAQCRPWSVRTRSNIGNWSISPHRCCGIVLISQRSSTCPRHHAARETSEECAPRLQIRILSSLQFAAETHPCSASALPIAAASPSLCKIRLVPLRRSAMCLTQSRFGHSGRGQRGQDRRQDRAQLNCATMFSATKPASFSPSLFTHPFCLHGLT